MGSRLLHRLNLFSDRDVLHAGVAIEPAAGQAVARVLGGSIEDLLGTPTTRTAGKRGPQPKIAQQLEQIRSLPVAEQRAISRVLDSVLAAHQ